MRPLQLPLLCAVVALICTVPSLAFQPAATTTPASTALERADPRDPAAILTGIHTIVAPGTPGTLAVWGPQSVALVGGRVHKDLLAPVAAAGPLSRGRVIALAHTGFLDDSSLATGDTRAFLTAAIRWAAGKPGDQALRVGLLRCNLDRFITDLGLTPVRLSEADLSATLAERHLDVLCIVGPNLSDTQQKAVASFVAAGGGLIAAQTAWAWNGQPTQSLADNPLNRLFAPAGIAWTDGTCERTASPGFTIDIAPLQSLHAAIAIDELIALGKLPLKPDARARQLALTAAEAARVLPPDDTVLRPRLRDLLAKRDAAAIPTHDAPLRQDRPIDRLLNAFELADLQRAEATSTRPHPAAAAFPGSVPADAPRVERTINVDLSIPEWHSTGLYAAPGEPITIHVPDATPDKLVSVRIGCHKDELWHLDSWQRMPEITRQWPLTAGSTTVASSFGGPLYIVVTRKPKQSTGTLDVTISSAVEAPLFTLGKTTSAEWRDRLRKLPAPWAELATDRVLLSVPSDTVRHLDDPGALLQFWNRLADAEDDLGGIPTSVRVGRPERFVADVQISAGYMHSGYPIMTHLDAAADMVSLDKLRAGTWGLLHELGHNHQRPEWTFHGTGEVTNNVFVLYALQTVCNRAFEDGHPSLKKRDEKIAAYLADGARFQKWQADPFLALQMYAQLVEGFGWDTYKRVLAEYRDLPDADRPKTEEQKRDQWLTRFSRAAGKNLGPFFQAWGVPTSDAARASIADLPDWMPPGFPPPAPTPPVER
jgi:hypothetical protein